MSNTIRVAVSGAGAISEFHLKGWQAQDGVELVAISDPDLDRARARAAEFSIPQVFDDTEKMLDEVRPDAVDIITPVGTHATLVKMAADRSIHVKCQKPMTPTVAEAEELIGAVGEKVRFMVHENYRFRPHYAEVAQRVGNNEVGKVLAARLTVRSSSLNDYPGKTPFLLGRQPYLADFKRLLVFEILIHHLDALRSILGELEVVSAHLGQVNKALSGEDMALVTLRTTDGALVLIDANVSALGYPAAPHRPSGNLRRRGYARARPGKAFPYVAGRTGDGSRPQGQLPGLLHRCRLGFR